ncbi:hypothetical protein CW304_27795 [Bacillus sp. UFRGS-B20]|nr:hypothetical protein CW304_27795 [Bacillus sp. UFRGS-B20]
MIYIKNELYLESSKLEHKLVAKELRAYQKLHSQIGIQRANISIYSLMKISGVKCLLLDRNIQEDILLNTFKETRRQNINVKTAF